MKFSGVVVLLFALLQNALPPAPPPPPVRVVDPVNEAILQAAGQRGLQPQVPLEPGSIEGVVVESGNGRPIAGVTVQVRVNSNSTTGAAGSYVTSTRDDGIFIFRSVPPGNYVLQADRGGYIPEVYGTTPNPYSLPMQPLAPAQKLTGVRLALTRGAVIAGRLIDDRGEVVAGAVVQALKTTYKDGLRERTLVQSTPSNDLGEYRLFMLRPGEYYVTVVPPTLSSPQLPYAPSVVPSFFPDTIDAKAAKPLALHEGEVLDSINFSAVPTRTRRVTGSVQGNAGDPVGVILSPLNGTSGIERTLDPNEGAFQFSDVVPGSYMLVARTHMSRAVIPLDVRNADMLNMRIVVGPGFRTPVHARIEGHPAGDDPEAEKLYFNIRRETPIRGLDPDTYSPFANGRFTLDLLAGDYRIDITQPEGYYVKSMMLDGVDILNQGLHLTGSTDATMEIVVASDSGSLEGRTQGRESTIVLVPDAARRGQRALFKSMKVSANGGFRFEKLPPGDYKLFAWTEENGGPWLDPEYLRKYEDRGTPVRVEGGKKTMLDRPLTPLLD